MLIYPGIPELPLKTAPLQPCAEKIQDLCGVRSIRHKKRNIISFYTQNILHLIMEAMEFLSTEVLIVLYDANFIVRVFRLNVKVGSSI